MLAGNVPVGLEPVEILPDGGLGDVEGIGQVANPGAALFLDPFEDLAPPRLGQQRAAGTVSQVRSLAAVAFIGSRGRCGFRF